MRLPTHAMEASSFADCMPKKRAQSAFTAASSTPKTMREIPAHRSRGEVCSRALAEFRAG